MHISPTDLPGGVGKNPCPLDAVFLLTRSRRGGASSIRPVSRAEALARFYGNALNPLAHPGEGLDWAERIAAGATVVELCTAELAESCRLIVAALDGRGRG